MAEKMEKEEIKQKPKQGTEVILNWLGKRSWAGKGGSKERDKNVLVIPMSTYAYKQLTDVKGVKAHYVLTPGINRIPRPVWDVIRQEVTYHLEKGNLVEKNYADVVTKKVKLTEDAKAATMEIVDTATVTDLVNLGAKEAAKLVGDCLNMETLLFWQEKETRDGVLKVIRQQIEKIKKNYSEDSK